MSVPEQVVPIEMHLECKACKLDASSARSVGDRRFTKYAAVDSRRISGSDKALDSHGLRSDVCNVNVLPLFTPANMGFSN